MNCYKVSPKGQVLPRKILRDSLENKALVDLTIKDSDEIAAKNDGYQGRLVISSDKTAFRK